MKIHFSWLFSTGFVSFPRKQSEEKYRRKRGLLRVITHPLIFARFYWLLYVTWCKITGQLSRNNPRLRGYLSSDFFFVEKKQEKPAGKSFTFSSLLFYMEEKQTRFVKSSHNEIKKLVGNAVPESTKKVNKICSQRL